MLFRHEDFLRGALLRNLPLESNLMIDYQRTERKRFPSALRPSQAHRRRAALTIRERADKALARHSNGSAATPGTFASRPQPHLLLFRRRATNAPALPPRADRGASRGTEFRGQSRIARSAAAQKRSCPAPCGTL